jgi:rare lipoprotein A
MLKSCLLISLVLVMGMSSINASAAGQKASKAKKHAKAGIASIYSYKGEKTANGEVSHPDALTAAHRSLPFGTRVRVTNKKNKKSVVVRINDRGPFIRGRVIDVTPAAAGHLGFDGLTSVNLQVVTR